MTYQEQHKALENRIISSLCEIKKYSCELLPHTVFVEEAGEDCSPVYNKYSLVSINQSEKTYMQNPFIPKKKVNFIFPVSV